MTTLANAIHKAKKLALETQVTAYVIFDPSHLDNPPDLAYYAATEEEADTFFASCEIWTRWSRRTSWRRHDQPGRYPSHQRDLGSLPHRPPG